MREAAETRANRKTILKKARVVIAEPVDITSAITRGRRAAAAGGFMAWLAAETIIGATS
jgi:hypothetical protein